MSDDDFLWSRYVRIGAIEARPYIHGESMKGISVSDADQPPKVGGMIARNPDNHADQWYIAEAYFAKQYTES